MQLVQKKKKKRRTYWRGWSKTEEDRKNPMETHWNQKFSDEYDQMVFEIATFRLWDNNWSLTLIFLFIY